MLTMYGCLKCSRRYFSLRTELTDRFPITFDFAISFRAYSYLFYFISTRHTRPKPPLPITYKNLNECFPIPEGTLIASLRGDSYDVFRE